MNGAPMRIPISAAMAAANNRMIPIQASGANTAQTNATNKQQTSNTMQYQMQQQGI